MDRIKQLKEDIIQLRIQGATNVALATLDGVIEGLKMFENLSLDQLHKKLKDIADDLAYARPTEPLAQNAVRYVFNSNLHSRGEYVKKIEEYKNFIASAKMRMSKVGMSMIKDGGCYLTHCHSSTVTSMFLEAKKQGKKFSVIATETRPLFQGRVTVKELLEGGIEDVTLIIDDAATSIISGVYNKIDAVFIGADLLTETGFVNKIGSMGIALACKEYKTPLYSMSILLKYDPRDFSYELIEKRKSEEVWPEATSKLKIYSPAFDFVSYSEIIKIVCEEGILENNQVKQKALLNYNFIKI
jgi:ribose 1,5-bisphosphate isomerase